MKDYNFRDYKFRGKSLDTNDFVVGYYVKNDCDLFEDKIYNPDYKIFVDIKPNTIGQYTGLKDINGKEIYEGDIVAEKGHYVKSDKILYQKIQWKDTYSCWLRGEYQRLTPKNIKLYQIEVVGNIYENTDLLKKEE